jgi:hypothetical protein
MAPKKRKEETNRHAALISASPAILFTYPGDPETSKGSPGFQLFTFYKTVPTLCGAGDQPAIDCPFYCL